jgi:hypothetical protein
MDLSRDGHSPSASFSGLVRPGFLPGPICLAMMIPHGRVTAALSPPVKPSWPTPHHARCGFRVAFPPVGEPYTLSDQVQGRQSIEKRLDHPGRTLMESATRACGHLPGICHWCYSSLQALSLGKRDLLDRTLQLPVSRETIARPGAPETLGADAHTLHGPLDAGMMHHSTGNRFWGFTR